jgi:hypothetical protein
MTHFIDIGRGKRINLAHVESVEERYAPGKTTTTFYAPGHTLLGTTESHLDLDEALSPVVPAAAGAVATVVHICFLDERPTEGDFWIDRQPIVAWRLTDTYAVPVIPDGSSGTILIEQPDGQLQELAGATYDNLDDAKAKILRTAQDEWDREHSDTITSEAAE